jgi:DNA modification methylase
MIINANSLHIPLADNSVNCCVTSPPYYGLRDYGTAKWEGGDPECDRLGKLMPTRTGFNERYFGRPSSENNKQDAVHEPMGQVCAKCGAIRIDQQIGLEQTPDEYIANLVQVFREVKRVLRDDGTLWLNLGDSYNSQDAGANPGGFQGKAMKNNPDMNLAYTRNGATLKGKLPGLKPKDLIGIPWMAAFALRADGWYLRQDIIWAKPNPMPESVKDRCTKAHEYVFLLSKSAQYYYDYEAVLEPATGYDGRKDTMFKGSEKYKDSGQTFAERGHERWQYKNLQPDGQQPNTMHLNRLDGEEYLSPVRNKRSVWTVTTKPYKGAHFATFPPDLIKPMILAGCPKDGVVLDPFVGSGTTVMAAMELGRKGIGLDLNLKYLDVNARERTSEVQPILI